MPLPTSADSTKPAAPPMTATAMPPPVDSSAIWLMRMAPWRMMKPPDPSWPISAAIATRPKYTPTQDGSACSSTDDQRRQHRRQHAADRAAGLLQKHRHDGDQHAGQVARFPWMAPVPTQTVRGVNVAAPAGFAPWCCRKKAQCNNCDPLIVSLAGEVFTPMRVAQIAPLTESVPPRLYGGTERIVSFLTEELVAMGHDVTLFASGDSVTTANLVAAWPCALRFDPTVRDPFALHMLMMEQVCRNADEFDILHFHTDYWSFSLFGRQPTPFLTTLHGRLDLPELSSLYEYFTDVPLVSISDAQRRPLPHTRIYRHGASRPAGEPAHAVAGQPSIWPSLAGSPRKSAPTMRSGSRARPAFS